jgi:hypothetical protein
MRIHHPAQPMLDCHKAKELFWDPLRPRNDPSREAQAEACTTYRMVVEWTMNPKL